MRHVPENRYWPGRTFYVTAPLNRPHRAFAEARAAQLVVDTLQFFRTRGEIRLYGYVVMPDHVHLIVQMAESKTLPKFMNQFKSYVGHELGCGSIWQPGYWSELIESHEFLLQKLKYIHANPVKAGLTVYAEDYLWSSARHYLLTPESGQVDFDW